MFYRESRRTQERILTVRRTSPFEFSKPTTKLQHQFSRRFTRDVEQDFSKYYRMVNREDEATFQGKLVPSIGKLGFDVDFLRPGILFHQALIIAERPPRRPWGICLYLALMKHTLGSNFTFSVLDDVLMSVDANHPPRNLCLAKDRIPKNRNSS